MYLFQNAVKNNLDSSHGLQVGNGVEEKELNSSSNLEEGVDSILVRLKPYKYKHCDCSAPHAGTLKTHVAAVHKGMK